MHHKRRRQKSARAGCLLCKPHKGPGRGNQWNSKTPADRRAMGRADVDEGLLEHLEGGALSIPGLLLDDWFTEADYEATLHATAPMG